jgi:hypothetical protein
MPLSPAPVSLPVSKRPRIHATFSPTRIATPEAAAAADAHLPLQSLLEAVENGVKKPKTGGSVVFWMRMSDLRSKSFLYPAR